MKIRFLEYLSTNVPAYIPQKRVSAVIIKYQNKKKFVSDICAKYQGIANILIPCASPETIFDKKRRKIAFLFFMITKLTYNYLSCIFDL